MVSRGSDKKKAKRKAKMKQRRSAQQDGLRLEKAAYFFEGAQYHLRVQSYQKALLFIRKALKLKPDNADFLYLLAQIGSEMEDAQIELEGLSRLHQLGRLEDRLLPSFINLLTDKGSYELALEMGDLLLERLTGLTLPNKRKLRADLKRNQAFCRIQLEAHRRAADIMQEAVEVKARRTRAKAPAAKPAAPASPPPAAPAPAAPEALEPALPDIPVSIAIDEASFQNALSSGVAADYQAYTLVQEARRIRFMDSFESLICLANLREVRSFWYQEETARKVLKTFRGRALLSDEVGLGKTIEASMVLKEYMQRGMVKSVLILTPTPLVSQWREELKSKFDLDFPSTDDPAYRSGEPAFWEQPRVLASINQAKSKRNFDRVTAREYDLVIVDEAHHLKNRNTLNWKLVNALKKRFLLLLTATPVENNLMELYNLITLLKPGQLKTATAFREEFMTRGDPTSPQNRARLKELLGQVMIRNTRAVAKINIPPRFAETVRVEPTGSERELYDRISTLVRSINRTDGAGSRLLLKNLLAEAGSSPRAVELTLSRMAEKKDLPADHRRQIQAIGTLSRSMGDTRKNRLLHDIIRATPGKTIIFVKYIGTLEHITDFLGWEKIPFAVFHGRMTNAAKDEQIELFRNQRDILVTTEVGGEGRNLQFCHQMINYDLPWNPMKIEQRIGRLHRIGQEKEVRIFNLCAAESVEDYILEILDRKINMFEMVIGEIEMVLGRVSGEKDFSDRVIDIWLESPTAEERKAGFARLATQIKRSKTQYETTKTLDEKLFGENYEL
jgi:superfamily II DNA or RNA helicase